VRKGEKLHPLITSPLGYKTSTFAVGARLAQSPLNTDPEAVSPGADAGVYSNAIEHDPDACLVSSTHTVEGAFAFTVGESHTNDMLRSFKFETEVHHDLVTLWA